MKTTLLLLIALLPTLASAQSVGLVDRYMEAWNNHDAVAAANFFQEDVAYYDASTGAPVVGKAQAQEKIIQAFLDAVPDLTWTRDQTAPIVGPDGVAFQWTFSGTNTGKWSDGTPATKKKFSIHGATLMRLRGGKIAYQGDFYDAHTLYKQLGLTQ